MLYAYRAAKHTSTGAPPFQLMYGRQPELPTESSIAFDAYSYQTHLRAKLAELHDLVSSKMAEAANRQQQGSINQLHSSYLNQEILFGYPFLRQVNYYHDGKGTGRLKM